VRDKAVPASRVTVLVPEREPPTGAGGMAARATVTTAQPGARSNGRGLGAGGAAGAVALALAAALLVGAVGLFLVYASAEKAQAVGSWKARLSAMADDRKAAIGTWVDDRVADVSTLARFPTVVAVLTSRAAGPQPRPDAAAELPHLQGVLDGFREAHGHRALYILDAKGAVVIRNSSVGGPDEVCTALGERFVRTGAPFAHFCTGVGGTPWVLFGAPIVGSDGGSQGRPVGLGFAVVASDPTAWLYPLLTREPTPTVSGEVLLAEREGDEIVFLSPLRHVRARPLGFRVPLTRSPLAARAAIESVAAFGEYVDYRGVPVFAAAGRIAGTPWGLVAKVDRDEALAAYRDELTSSALTVGALVLAILGTGFGLWRARRAKYEAEIARGQARLALLLDQANDAILFIAPDGQILDANWKAEELYGYSREELLWRNLRDLRAEETRGSVVEQMARAAEPAGHVFATVHRRKDGATFPVEVSSRLVEFDRGKAFLSIVRDLSERKRAQAAIQVSETRYRRLFESAKDGILILDADSGKIADANPFLTEILGYSKDELLGKKLWDIGPFKDITATKAGFGELLEKGYVRYENLPLQASNGLTIDVEFVSNAYLVDGKKVIQCNIRDISDRTRAEKALRESEERYRRLVDNVQDVVFTLSVTGELTSLNPAFERITGWPSAQWLGKSFAELVHPDDLSVASDLLGKFLRGQAPGLFEVRIKARDGSWLDGEFSGVQLVEHGRVTGVLATARDITLRKREGEERRRLAAAVQQSAEAIVVTDPRGTIEYVNPAFEWITGYSASEAIGQNPRFLKSGRHDAHFYREMWETLKRGEVWSGRLVNRRKDGVVFEEDATISPVRDPLGRIEHFVAVKRDVTQETAVEERLRQAQRIEAVGRLAGGVAHDFNNLLQAMLSQIQLIRARPGDPARVSGTVNELEQHIRRGAALSRQLLLFSRRETAKPESLDLNEVLEGATQLLRRLVRENVIVTVELVGEALPVVADRGQLDQVLMNLVVNAADAMPEGGRIVIRSGSRGGTVVWLSVEDTGHGIPQEIRDRIFEPFVTTKGEEKGSGLGLSVVHGIVVAHRGTIEVSDREGGGTVFRIELPRDTSGEVASPVRPGRDAQEVPRGTGERIIVVEDEAGAREGLLDLLTMLGFEVTAVGSAGEAERLPAQPAFDVLLSDILLPDVSGADLARRLQERWPQLKVILMSGYTEDEAVRRDVGAGTVRFLQKPFDMMTLAREIRMALAPS
jgi:two-component system cell cycle sensor histidine kinase/response regulator CckA